MKGERVVADDAENSQVIENGHTGKRRKRKDNKQQKSQAQHLLLEPKTKNSSSSRKKQVRAKLKATSVAQCSDTGQATDPDTSSSFTASSDISSSDDAASIESRIKQLVVEQEEKLELDNRYRSTPILARRAHDSGDHDSDNRYVGENNVVRRLEGCADANESPYFSRAKSTNDLATIGGALKFGHKATLVESQDVPDVFVIQVDGKEQQEVGSKTNDKDEFCEEVTPKAERNNNNDFVNHRARSSSVAGRPTARQASHDDENTANKASMRRNISSSHLPERGNLRNLNSNRNAGVTGDLALDGRDRSNTDESVDKSNLFGFGLGRKATGDTEDSMLSIHRSAWTLCDFDQTFNKSALVEQQKASEVSLESQSKVQQQFSAISNMPRGGASSDLQKNCLLKRASKNAIAGFNNQQPEPLTVKIVGGAEPRYSLKPASSPPDRRPSFSHSIVSIPSSVESYNQFNQLSPYKHKHRPSFAAPNGQSDKDDEKSCLKSCLNLATLRQYLPILEWLPNYKMNTFYSDLGAGLAVAALNISTSFSAAVVAETSFGAAFRASIVSTFVYGILCSSRHTSFGSWSIMSQLLLVSVKRALNDEYILDRLNMGPSASWEPEEYERWHMNIMIMYTFLIGLVQLSCGALNLGNILSSFIPEALCSSMIAATAFTMAIGQLANMAGTSNKVLWQIERNTTELWADLKDAPVDITDLFANTFRWIQQIILLAKHYEQINVACLIISIISVILLLLNQSVIQQSLQRLFKKKIVLPFEMVLLVLWVVVSHSMDLSGTYRVTTCGPITIEFGLPNIPNLKLIRELWYNFLATALISYTMVYIMAKSYSNKLNYEVNYNQELIACGAGNLVGGLFDALPATASFSRTAGQVEAGGQTQMVSIVNCVLLVVLVRLLGQYVSVLPVCVMSAVLFFGFCRMMTRCSEALMYWRVCKVDFAIWVVTFIGILATDMVNGFMVGFIFSILTMLYRAQK